MNAQVCHDHATKPSLQVFIIALAISCVLRVCGATCSRVISVPVAPAGPMVVVQGRQVSGEYPELLRTLGRKINCRFEFTAVPRVRAERDFERRGGADLFLPASPSQRRAKYGRFVPLEVDEIAVFTLPRRLDIPADRAALLRRKDLRAAVVRGRLYSDEYVELLRELELSGRLHQVTNDELVGRMLIFGRVDFTLLPLRTGKGAMAAALSSLTTDGSCAALGLASCKQEFRAQRMAGLSPFTRGIYLSNSPAFDLDRPLIEQVLAAAPAMLLALRQQNQIALRMSTRDIQGR